MADKLSPEAFVARYGPLADDIARETGLHPSFVLGQAAHESNFGNNFVGNNIFGISRNDKVVEYPDISTNAQDYVAMIKRRYSGAAKLTDPKEQARVVAMLGYATDPDYHSKVSSRIDKVSAIRDEAKAPSVDDVIELAEPVLKHRMALTFAARAEGETITNVIQRLKARIG